MRTCGILMPVFSLPSPYGIGTLGKEAVRFVDFLKKSGQTYWQILPLNPTNYGDSPYQSFSAYAGNPYFIDIELLIEEGLLTKAEADSFDFGDDHTTIDYGKLYENRLPLLKLAFNRFSPTADFEAFCVQNAFWLDEYALFMALKNANGDRAWETWDQKLRARDAATIADAKTQHADTIQFYRFVQYLFYQQWHALKAYANKNGVYIIGDLPIYVAYDSADVWAAPEQFQLDECKAPKAVAGVPPDAFSADGQLWGNPLYDWDRMKQDGYAWWTARMTHALATYDVIRIDHFRGFASYFSIPYGEKTARRGKWVKGPGIQLFTALKEACGEMPIIAEDLGLLTDDVLELLKHSGFPGMKVLQFAFSPSEESSYLPHNFERSCVVYTGTHDNDTIMGWTENADSADVRMAHRYMHVDDGEGFNWAMMRTAMMSVADICILMMPDILGLGSEARINTPSTLGGNWQWRIEGGCINDWLANILYENTALYCRLSKAADEHAKPETAKDEINDPLV